MTPHRDPSCSRDLLWRVMVPSRLAIEHYASRLEGAGFRFVSDVRGVAFFESPEEHRLVLIPRTGRIQLRVLYTTATDQRSQVAATIAQRISASFEES